MVALGDLPGGIFASGATAVSADGAVIVGTGRDAIGNQAFRWTAAGGIVGIGFFPGGEDSQAFGVSSDGSVVVGACQDDNGNKAFRWTAASGMVNLGTLSGGNPPTSVAFGVSADGSVIVGQSSVTGGNTEAFRWTAAGMVGLGVIGSSPFGTGSVASATDTDGSVVVGTTSTATNSFLAYRWTATGGMIQIGSIDGEEVNRAMGVSADGDVVVGISQRSGGRAFVWTPGGGMQNLREVLIAQGVDMTGWALTDAMGVSADGRVIVGSGINPQGQVEAYRAVLAPSGHRWIDPTGGSWDVASNWNPATVPGSDDPVRFDLDATYTVTGGSGAFGAATARALAADHGTVDFELGGLALTSPSTDIPSVTVSFDATAKIIAGTSTFVNGVVGFGSNAAGDTTTTARLQVFNTGTQLTGSGGLVAGGFLGGRGEIFVAGGTLRTAAGAIGAGAIGEAVVGNGGTWTADNILSVGLLSTGRLTIENGGGVTTARLQIGDITDPATPASVVDVTGFGAGERSRLFATDSLIVGGSGPARLRVRDGAEVTAGHIVIDGDDGPLQEVRVGGAVTQGFDAELTATSITVGRGGTQNAYLDIRAGGAVEAERFYVGTSQSSGFAFVTGGATVLVRAAAFAGDCQVAIGGGGVLAIKEGGLVTCDQASVGLVSDGRVFVGENGGAPTASSLVVSRVLKVGEGGQGVLSLAAGVVDAVDSPSTPPADPFDVIVFGGGQVEGTGTIVGSLDANGTTIPGGIVVVPPPPRSIPEDADPAGAVAGGTLLILGRVVMHSGSTLATPIAGADSTLQGRLRVAPAHGMDGSVALAGELRLDFQNGYAPNTGDQFLLLDAASATGSFESTQFTGLEPGWQFEVVIANGTVVLNSLSDGVSTTFPTPAEPGAPTPAALVLHAPVPNPTAGATALRYELRDAGPMQLALYDALGREVIVLVDGDRPAGAHETALRAGALAHGIYIARLTAGAGATVRRLTVIR